ncbi:Alpha-protein kinase vwkA [Madurella fahalii]|uniref:Alpha-protein kinase vwkA n=1 Tax=Madurella fahalii TaxID=1157608 RepID=A0ABQ0FWR1_9PEZI
MASHAPSPSAREVVFRLRSSPADADSSSSYLPPVLSASSRTNGRTSSATSADTHEQPRRAEEELDRLRRSAARPHMPPASDHTLPVTSTRTRERLRHVEEELEQMRRGGAGADMPPVSGLRSPTTSTRTRERVHAAEEELERMRRGPTALSTAPPTSTRTRERLREAEEIINRLKREGDTPALTPAETSRRLRDLRREEREAHAEAPRRPTTGLFKAACSTDLLFLIDTTGSMGSYIQAAKNQVRSIISDLGEAFLHEAELRIAVVGYKDHCDSLNVQFLDFTPSASTVHSFLDGLTATGGGDAPEDVLGGIRQALNATWKHQTRCIIHIADAPPHGRTLHDLGDSSDSYANPGSEPHRLTHEALLSQLVGLHINYALLRINSTTDRMAFTFLQAYAAAAADCTLLTTNTYFSQVVRGQRRSAAGGLLFREAELGTTFAALRRLVVKAVTASVSHTAVRHVTRTGRTGVATRAGPGLAPVREDDDGLPDMRLETAPPQWDSPGWCNETLVLEGFGLDAVVHGATTLDDMMANDDNILISVLKLTICKRKLPFAQGALRVAFYTRTTASTNRYVVKSFKRSDSRLAVLAEDMRCQALCKSFALEFNSLLGGDHSIDFLVTACFKGESTSPGGDACISLEPFLEGTYVKYNGNAGYVNEDTPDDPANQAAQAFSHFTFERSGGQFLACDLQGVGGFLTDPVIHTADPDRFVLSKTNLGVDGFKLFFASHECNAVCRRLGLRSNRSMLASGMYEFRESWPTMADTVCCSNKLCRRILRRASANESEKFPGYHWCDTCLPQLEAFRAQWLCVEPGPAHYFEVSRFFYESQGQSTPRKCARHRGSSLTTSSSREDWSAERAALVGMTARRAVASTMVAGGLWGSLRSATVKADGR